MLKVKKTFLPSQYLVHTNYVMLTSYILFTKISEDSDEEDLFEVPDVEATQCQSVHSEATNQNSNHNQNNATDPQLQAGKRRRGRNPVDKEYRRLKRYVHKYILFSLIYYL